MRVLLLGKASCGPDVARLSESGHRAPDSESQGTETASGKERSLDVQIDEVVFVFFSLRVLAVVELLDEALESFDLRFLVIELLQVTLVRCRSGRHFPEVLAQAVLILRDDVQLAFLLLN